QIEQIGKLDNTLIMFLADNGGCAEIINRGEPGVPPGHRDSFTSYEIGWANASNTPFRLYKHWVHEGGISTPLIVHWPAMIKKPGITHQYGHLIDIMATCLDVAGVKYPKIYQGCKITPLEGKSLVPVLQGNKGTSDRPLFWEHEGNRAVRLGKWKLVSQRPGKWELYDLQADRTEMNNLAAELPNKIKELSDLYDRWAERCGVVPWKKILEIREQQKKAKRLRKQLEKKQR
ncbi:MAG: sulfatase-like hydrolase/transferase, partial [Planctomycetota bacterium]